MKALGVAAIKVTYSDQAHTGNATVPVMRAELMQAIIDEAHSLGLKTYAHAPTLAQAKEVLRAGADGLAHSVADAPVDGELIGLMRKNLATYTSTLALYTSFADVAAWMRRLEAIEQNHVVAPDVYERYKSPAGAKAYHAVFGTFPPRNLQHARANVRRLLAAGIPVLAATDTGVTGVLLGGIESDGTRVARRGWTHAGRSTSRSDHESGARIGSRQGSGSAGTREAG